MKQRGLDALPAVHIPKHILLLVVEVNGGHISWKNASNLLQEDPQLLKLVEEAWKKQAFSVIRDYESLQRYIPKEGLSDTTGADNQAGILESYKDSLKELTVAYQTPFLGDAPIFFYKRLLSAEASVKMTTSTLYAKVMPVVQSSGTGKSRMLTELGKMVFTLPVCLRAPSDTGYPLSDKAVYEYFTELGYNVNHDLDMKAHIYLASFIAAANQEMLRVLETAQGKSKLDARGLLDYWHERMEGGREPGFRSKFFDGVVGKARTMNQEVYDRYAEKIIEDFQHKGGKSGKGRGWANYIQTAELRTEEEREEIGHIAQRRAPKEFASSVYQIHASEATEALTEFISRQKLGEGKGGVCVIYFDEAHRLGKSYWILVRLIGAQAQRLPMWYVFMGTRTGFRLFNPAPTDTASLRLREQLAHLLFPHIGMGFDQGMVHGQGGTERVTMGELWGLEHICRYGRPLWRAQYESRKQLSILERSEMKTKRTEQSEETELMDSLVSSAGLKLTGGEGFVMEANDHVLAVVSQRICLDPVLNNAEGINLADRGVAHHMRILTGYSRTDPTFYTASPSEPMLALAAFKIMYDKDEHVKGILTTLAKQLCSGGLIEKGLVGELCSRILLVLARDAVVREKRWSWHEAARPVGLLEMLEQLLGRDWGGKDQGRFEEEFGDASVNFTHWIKTRGALPVKPDVKLLANLWARGAALQCSFNQVSIDHLIVCYHGRTGSSAVFEPALLSGVVVQVKNQKEGDGSIEREIRPMGLPPDGTPPRAYLSLVLELGTDRVHSSTKRD
ncbi:hypothetical protein JB92DRAFT_2807319 [Gautieria morchelliformis]|nr:hypothetical protein JB92DRAFT_2807319 [Gautieria morchelliformis]